MLGFDTAKESRRARSRVGYMPENDSFVAGLSVLQFVSLAGELHGQKPVAARRRAHEVLSLLGLEEARYRLIEEQPTGIRQRAKLWQRQLTKLRRLVDTHTPPSQIFWQSASLVASKPTARI